MLSFVDQYMNRTGGVLRSLNIPTLLVQSTYVDGPFERRSISHVDASP